MQLSAYSTYKRTVQLQRALRKARRKVHADGRQGTSGWGEDGALRAHRGTLSRVGSCSRLGECAITLDSTSVMAHGGLTRDMRGVWQHRPMGELAQTDCLGFAI